MERSGGTWVEWDAALAACDRGKPGRSPLRRVVAMRWVPKYPGETCWLIERWTPANAYGTPEQWYRPVVDGGTVLPCGIACCGDYPRFGDYEDIGARMHWYPTERHVTAAIDASERVRNALPATAFGRARRRTWNAVRDQEKRDAEFDRLAMDVMDDAMPAFHGAPVVGYGGSHRPALVELAEGIGIRQHPM